MGFQLWPTVFVRGADGRYHRQRSAALNVTRKKPAPGLPVLDFPTAQKIRAEFAEGNVFCTQERLARKYGVSRTAIGLILRGKTRTAEVHAN